MPVLQARAQSVPLSPMVFGEQNPLQLPALPPAVQYAGYTTDGRLDPYFDDSTGVAQAAPELGPEAPAKDEKAGSKDGAKSASSKEAKSSSIADAMDGG